MDIESLTGNSLVKNLLLKQLKSVVKEKGIKAILITPDSTGELNIEIHQEPIKVVAESDFNQLITQLLDNGKQ